MNSRPAPDAAPFDAVVLAGGRAARLGGADKPGVRVGGRALLDRVLAACAGAGTTVVVAAPRPTPRPVVWARESPAGGGPLAALDAGLRRTNAQLVVVLSADLPFLRERTVHRLIAAVSWADGQDGGHGLAPGPGPGPVPGPDALGGANHVRGGPDAVGGVKRGDGGPGAAGGAWPADGGPDGADGAKSVDGAMLVDPDGRDQPLVAVYRAAPLRAALRGLAESVDADAQAGPGTAGRGEARHGLAGIPLRRLVDRLDMVRVAEPLAAFDCDTWGDIATARARIREHGHVLDEWITAVKDELGIELDVDTGILLDLARDAAHGVARPAAPLTTFLVGYAAAQAGAGGGGQQAVAEAARKAAVLAARWADEDQPDERTVTPKPGTGDAAPSSETPTSETPTSGPAQASGPAQTSGSAPAPSDTRPDTP
ncbi:DUF6457 domain-containing protein [Streptomyces silvensis]|uniref:Uncharacterized protein n=1 Tax=Streptomyces silvensis TaxID=1765722 RepID=A0A0W7WZ83_9ACTN|nr:hypothetical protein AT728_14365 [Streptomyces silvensis]